jgi:mono/diheme cytochrome c family protein
MKALTLKTVSLLLFAMVVLTVSATVAAQGSAAQTPGRPTTDQAMSGEALFYQNCTFCHEHDATKRRLVPQFLGPTLIGTYKSRNLTDEGVRSLILNGVPKRMTGFRHTLTAKEIDDLIAYLKVR